MIVQSKSTVNETDGMFDERVIACLPDDRSFRRDVYNEKKEGQVIRLERVAQCGIDERTFRWGGGSPQGPWMVGPGSFPGGIQGWERDDQWNAINSRGRKEDTVRIWGRDRAQGSSTNGEWPA